MASFTTLPNGQQVVAQPPPLKLGFTQNIEGGVIDAAAKTTMNAQQTQVAASKALGVGQKGSSRKKHKKKRGGASTNVSPLYVPTANSIKGVSALQNHINLTNTHNQIIADKSYDALQNAPPIQMGGFRLRGAEDLYPGSGTQPDTKRRRRTKKRNGRSHKRVNSRRSRKSMRRSRRAH